MNSNDIRRFFATGKLTESFTGKSTTSTKSFTEAFDELSRLYEADEEATKPAEEKPAEANTETKGAETNNTAAPSGEVKTGAEELVKTAPNYDSFVALLQKDPKAAAFIDYIKKISPKGDRTETGIKTTVGSIDIVKGAEEGEIAAGGLHPTQNVIFMGKSFGANNGEKWGPLAVGNAGKSCLADFCFKNPSIGNDNIPIIVYKDGSNSYLIDGHHRWSKVAAVNPTGTMKALIFNTIEGFSWKDCLEAVQMAIEATGGYKKKDESLHEAALTEGGSSEEANLLTLKDQDGAITNAILSEGSKWLTDVANTRFLIEKWGKANELKIPENATEVPAEVRKACAEQIEANIKAGIKEAAKGAPARTNMPQVDAASSPSAALDQLKKGVVDITPKN